MHNQNIIILAQQNWDTVIGTNPRNMAKEFARYNRVLYVNMPLDINTVVRGYRDPSIRARLRVLLGRTEAIVEAEPNIWVFTTRLLLFSNNWLASKTLFSISNRFNSWWLARSIRKAANKLGFGSFYILQDGLIYSGLDLRRLLRPRAFIYNIRDYVMGVPYFQRHGARLEPAIMQEADIVTANSEFLRDYALPHNRHSYDIGQGCVLSMYQAAVEHPEPADIKAIAHPRIVYTGNLTALRLDLQLLLDIARQHPDWHLVLVGPEDADFAASALHQLPNVHFLGTKSPEQLAAYLQHADVCINPQLVNEITIGNYPLKIDEYLAMGKPVVATSTQAMEMFADYVYLATDLPSWLRLLEVALTATDSQQVAARIAFAQSHTWEATVARLYEAVDKFENQHDTSAKSPAVAKALVAAKA